MSNPLPVYRHPFFFLQVDRHLPTMTVEETLKFAFDSMAGGTHLGNFDGKDLNLSDEQKDLVAWMDAKNLKVMAANSYEGPY